MQVSLIEDKGEWNGYAEGFGAHPLQLWQWGELKGQTGPWTPYRLAVRDDDGSAVGGAQVLVRAMPFPFGAIAYAPRGPFAKEGRLAEVADAAADWCRDNTKSQSLKIDPAAGELAWPDGWEQSENILINKKLNLMFLIIHKTHYAHCTRFNVKILKHIRRVGKGKPCGINLT